MRLGRIGFGCVVLAGLVLAALPGRACAQKGHEDKKHYKVVVEFYEKDQRKEVKLDLATQEGRDKLAEVIRAGHLHHVTLDEPPKVIDIASDLALWTIVVFLLLFFVLKKAAWGPILSGLQKREDNIREAAEEAKRAREETQRVTAEFQAKMDQAYAEIPKLMDQARKDAQRLAEEMRAKAQADIQADRQRSLREIEMTKDQAMQEITKYAANLATLISAKAIHRALSLEDHTALVDEAIGEMRQAEK